jgi:hypothetical protein
MDKVGSYTMKYEMGTNINKFCEQQVAQQIYVDKLNLLCSLLSVSLISVYLLHGSCMISRY